MNKELTQEEAALLWAQKKRVQATYAANPGAWGDIVPIGSGEGAYWPTIFSKTKESYLFRLAPEPPAKKWRPWTPEEVPVGARFRFNDAGSHQWIITGWNLVVIHISNPARHSIPMGVALSEICEHSLDNGKTWLRCGVEVEP